MWPEERQRGNWVVESRNAGGMGEVAVSKLSIFGNIYQRRSG
jgi:hypothetical protein